MQKRPRRSGRAFERLVSIMATLRSANGCPWDRKQTHESLRPFLIEEAYELIDAIDKGRTADLPGELGDVLFQCVFHAQIGAERRRFDIVDAVNAISDKLIRRHPHVFTKSGKPLGARGRKKLGLNSPDAVLTQWEAIKAKEQGKAGKKKRILSGIPQAMPALLRAHEISERVAAVGFEWKKTSEVVDKIDEEVRELREALTESPARAEEELGDLLFAIAGLARKINLEPEAALRKANEKFTKRFERVESELEKRGTSVHQSTLEEMDGIWQEIKHKPTT
jgi:tetrapyrrole methylase family protein/MazG family protein